MNLKYTKQTILPLSSYNLHGLKNVKKVSVYIKHRTLQLFQVYNEESLVPIIVSRGFRDQNWDRQ